MRFEAQRWRVHPYQGRELDGYVSDPDESAANEWAIQYVETLQKEGYTLELVENDGVHATKGDTTFVVKVEQKAS